MAADLKDLFPLIKHEPLEAFNDIFFWVCGRDCDRSTAAINVQGQRRKPVDILTDNCEFYVINSGVSDNMIRGWVSDGTFWGEIASQLVICDAIRRNNTIYLDEIMNIGDNEDLFLVGCARLKWSYFAEYYEYRICGSVLIPPKVTFEIVFNVEGSTLIAEPHEKVKKLLSPRFAHASRIEVPMRVSRNIYNCVVDTIEAGRLAHNMAMSPHNLLSLADVFKYLGIEY